MASTKDEDIEELNDILDSLSSARARQIFHKLTVLDLIDLKHAVEDAVRAAEKRGAAAERHELGLDDAGG